ncbi:hypothetical protein SNEBB_008423 [Seison nebaliae]|nr:hypothetical protein SNEBB_008423 [Seison nebaliae]
MPAIPQNSFGSVSCTSRIKMGVQMGCMTGLAFGILIGGGSSLFRGLRGRELMKTVAKQTVQMSASFGMFMGIGAGIRC